MAWSSINALMTVITAFVSTKEERFFTIVGGNRRMNNNPLHSRELVPPGLLEYWTSFVILKYSKNITALSDDIK